MSEITHRTEFDIQKLNDMNCRCLMILGYAMATIQKYYHLLNLPESCIEHEQYIWFMQACENIIYFDKPLPPCP